MHEKRLLIYGVTGPGWLAALAIQIVSASHSPHVSRVAS